MPLANSPQPDAKTERRLAKAYTQIGKELDPVEKTLSKWGKVTVSELVLLPNKGQFNLNYATNTAFYIARAREDVDGSARRSVEQSLQLAMSLKAGLQPDLSLGQPPRASDNTTLPPGNPAGGTAGQAMSSKTPTPVLTPFSGDLNFRERIAMTAGINDKMAEIALSLLANPEGVDGDKKVFFGVLQVTCQPGSQTRKGYIADVNVTLEYARYETTAQSNSPACQEPERQGQANQPASKPAAWKKGEPPRLAIPKSSTPGRGVGAADAPRLTLSYDETNRNYLVQPAVFAVLPLMDSQRLDLRSSRRDQVDLALALAAALKAQGMNAEASTLINYVKRREADMNTRTAVTTATTYSDGTSFGFQIYPGFQAVDKPSAEHSRSADVLQPISFPAVVVVIVDKQDLQNAGKPYTELAANVRTRWIPIDGGCAQTESQRIALASHISRAWGLLSAIQAVEAANSFASHSYFEARREIRSLEAVALGKTRVTSLPEVFHDSSGADQPPKPAPKPTLDDIPNMTGFMNAPTLITLSGSHFLLNEQPAVKSVTLAGRQCEFTVVSDSTLIATIPSGSFVDGGGSTPARLLSVATKGGKADAAVTIAFSQKIAEASPSKPSIKIVRDGQGKVTGISVVDPGSLDAKGLLDLVKDILVKTDAAPAKIKAGKS